MRQFNLAILLILCTFTFFSCKSIHSVFCGDSCDSKTEQDHESAEHNTTDTIACQLTNSDLAKRKSLLWEEMNTHLVKHEETPKGYILFFAYDQNFNHKLLDYVMAENECCPFLTFDLKLKSDDLIRLEISGPKIAKSMIRDAIFPPE